MKPRSPVLNVVIGATVTFHVFVFVTYYQWRLTTPTSVLGSDLRAFYTSWRMLLDGHGRRLYDIGSQLDAQSRVMGRPMTTDTLLAYVNPPFVSLAFVWLGFVRVRVAYALFSALQLLALGLAGRRMLRTQMATWSDRSKLLFLASGILSTATLSAITLGTFTPTVLLAVVAISTEYRSAVRNGLPLRPWRVAAWLCVLAVKPQLAVFVVVALVATREWKVLRNASVLGAGLVAVSCVVCGVSVWTRYFDMLRTYGGSNGKFGGDSRYMWNIRGVLSRVDGVSLGRADRISGVLYIVGLLAFGFWVRQVWAKQVADGANGVALSERMIVLERITVLTLTLTVLLTPHCNRQDTLLLVPAVVSLINIRRLGARSVAEVDWFAVVACGLSAVALMWDNDPFGHPLHPVTVLALVATGLVWRSRAGNIHLRKERDGSEVAGNLVAL